MTMMGDSTPVRELAQKWLDQDHDQETRQEIEALLASGDGLELEKRLRPRIAFGTAGLRSSMRAGYAHMNSLTVAQASHGLARYILAQRRKDHPEHEKSSVVIGYDGRHNSEKYARLTAAAFLAEGFGVLWFGRVVHTPSVPFAVHRFAAAAGVMITASHNPKNDNGYKVYWSNGSQIIPPHDQGIAASIDQVDSVLDWDTTTVDRDDNVRNIYQETFDSYMESIQSLNANASLQTESFAFTYTAMHGVGLPFMQHAARVAGISDSDFNVVAAQAHPDPNFPTVPFPNPEEKGALNLAIEEAQRNHTTIVLANDPDADRFSVAQKKPDGEWYQFTGNEIGILLASHVFETRSSTPPPARLAMLASTVSSRMLAAMATAEGFHFQDTLTGFKWLGNVGQNLQQAGYDVAFAFEEAIGFMFPSVVWDKDGVAAAMVFLAACRRWREQRLTPWEKLQTLYQRYGYFVDANTYLISPSATTTKEVFATIRTSNNGQRPVRLAQRPIQRWRDLTTGYDSASADRVPDLPVDPSAQMITCRLDDIVFTVRGSGTEPKIKLYIEARADSYLAAKSAAEEVLGDLLREWFKPRETNLRLAGHI